MCFLSSLTLFIDTFYVVWPLCCLYFLLLCLMLAITFFAFLLSWNSSWTFNMCLCAPLCLTCFVGKGFQHIKSDMSYSKTIHQQFFFIMAFTRKQRLVITQMHQPYDGNHSDKWKSTKVSDCQRTSTFTALCSSIMAAVQRTFVGVCVCVYKEKNTHTHTRTHPHTLC